MTQTAIGVAKPSENLPVDLRQWVDERRLIKFALEGAQRVFSRTDAVGVPVGVALNPQMMLTLLTYSYAAGIHASEDIEWFLHHDPGARYICAGNFPGELSIRIFRRANRPMIAHCLVHVFQEARKWKHANPGVREVEEPSFEAKTYASIVKAVQRKLQLAVLMDTAANEYWFGL